ncbi:MAG TPA: MASE1 domain-containing protein [Woeseiaceae bacterium]|nr:MASE1 domain-containing protein [Woeseiaceae bacterium]
MPVFPARPVRSDLRRDLLRACLFALAYFIGAELAYALSLGPSVGGTFWPPAGIALAAFLVAPRRVWPHLLLAGVVANFASDQLHGQSLPASLAFIVANLSEPLVGAWLLRKIFTAPVTFTRLPEIIAFALVSVLVAAPLAAVIGGMAAEWWTEDAPGFAAGWRTWWVGDAVGALVLAPAAVRVIMDWRQTGALAGRRWLEAAAFAIAVFAVTQLVFSAPPTAVAMPFLVFPVLLWGSLRFGPIGVGGALCLVVLLTALDTAAGHGPFAATGLSLGERLMALQVYVGVMALTFHGLAVLWEERLRTAHREQLLDAERVARGEAERASQLKEEFLAMLSHELRSPLNAILGWTHVLRKASHDPELASAVDTIERNALAQAKLIDDLLDMSRIMAGKVGLTLVPVKPAEILTIAADALRPAAEAKGVTLSVDLGNAAGVSLRGDATRLQQVASNLLGNGIKFTPAGGRVEAELAAGARQLQLVVRDTGQGIPAEFMPAVFERFRQADGSITRRHGGLGLGLSIARQIVELHGGSINAFSEGAGRGATFTVTLPLAAEGGGQGAAAAGESQAMPLSGLHVLIVDDEADARELLRRLLLEQGCKVDVAASAEEALALLAAGTCDVLLTDIGMPGTDGYELLRRVRAEHADQKAIAVTAFARPEDRDRALAAGFDGHLPKPVNPARLLQMVAGVAAAGRAGHGRPVSSP